MSTIVLTGLLLSQLIGLTDFIFSQDCGDELEKLTATTTAKAQALIDSSSKGEEGLQLQKLLPTLQTSRSQASLKTSRSQASLRTSQA